MPTTLRSKPERAKRAVKEPKVAKKSDRPKPDKRTTKAARGASARAGGAKAAGERVAPELDKRELLASLRRLQRGELDARLPDHLDGIDGSICEAFNELATMAQGLDQELSELRSAIGSEGQTRRRLRRPGLRGGWSRCVVSVNELLDDLTEHTEEMAQVVAAVARGNLSQKVDVEARDTPLRGHFLRHARTVNDMVDQLAALGYEVTRVAQEVGVEGKLGAQASVKGSSGAWKELTQSVNLMANNLTQQVREIARVTTAVAQGDLSKTVNIEVRGEILELKNTINTMVAQLSSFADEVTRVAREVGTEGILGGQARVHGVSGVWRELTENVNSMGANLTDQVRSIADVSSAIANGDLSKKITVEVRGEILELKNTINTMVDQLSSFADEVTRVAREVGTDGVLGGQAEVKGVRGVWRELTENVNSMGANLTTQVRSIADVVTAIAEGDLSKKIAVDARGEILTLKKTINATVDKLGSFSSEVTRVARLVGTEGTLGVQAEVKDVSGIWKELTDNVNQMGRNLTDQVRDIAAVTTAVASGDLSKKITVEVRGEMLALKNTINAMVDSLSSFADEVTRMAREVGTEGVLGGQAKVRDVSGIWKELTDNVNSMASDLTNQVRNIAEVASAVAAGDLSKKITVDARGEVRELKSTINAMVDQLNAFAAEVTRVARDVGVEGKLGGQALVPDARGTWKELTDNVNLMASNLTNQVRDIAEVTTSVAGGDLTRKISVEARGEILELKNTINTMVDQLSSFAEEVTRLASDVGIEGKLGGQADVRGVLGTWRDLTDAVNSMATNLTDQVRNISQVASAIAQGDLQKKIVVNARGEILELKNTINTMVDQLGSFAEQVTRMAREVGTEGNLGGQASVEGVRGIWKELTDNVNMMANNLTSQVRDIAAVTTAVASGQLGRKITVEVRGELLELKNTINTMVDQLSAFADEVTRVSREVGVEGKLGGQAEVRGVSGTWKELTDNVNIMASNLTDQVRDIASVTTAVARGDLSKKITVEVSGEILELKNTINTMVDQLSAFADEVTRVAREVGTEGILGGQAQVKGVSGTWRELTDNVNVMASNLTQQVRGIAAVVTAVANGNLKHKLSLQAKGELATLVDTINNMIVTLSTFADQVTSVARDVGVEGKLGGQADVPGAAGIWRDLTNNVNELAGNLTAQVRAIGDVATAVTKGDLTRTITVEARGEVAQLKDNINQMIGTLAETTRVNKDQDWLKTNLTRFTRMLQGQRDLLSVARQVLSELAPVVEAQHGVFYVAQPREDGTRLKMFASYAYRERQGVASDFALGEGLVGQAALEKKRILVRNAPAEYIQISSALGEASPRSIAVVPILFEDEVKGVIELASFESLTQIQLDFLEQLLESLGIVVATIEATMRTDELLRQSQTLAAELKKQQRELQQTNEQLEEKARQLTAQKSEVERKNREVEIAKQELEEKAEQLSLTSRYKSQFLANMSHELRTPLNSLLILSRQLADNRKGNLEPKQVEYASTISQAGSDLLSLINEILDLAKIESGTMAIDVRAVSLAALSEYVTRTFRQVAEEKKLSFRIDAESGLPAQIRTDEKRLKQVLRNLLSNAFKFTDAGEVRLRMYVPGASELERCGGEFAADSAVAFAVEDTGVGIAPDKHRLIFEAFQQADGSTNRRYGGTGLGLSISREIASLLGGVLRVRSEPSRGSVFTLYLPRRVALSSPGELAPAGQLSEGRAGSELSLLGPSHGPLATPLAIVADDRAELRSGDCVVLIIEGDAELGATLLEACRARGFRVVVGRDGTEGLELARELEPAAIVLDGQLDDMHGLVVLDRLKHDAALRHAPVCVIAPAEAARRYLRQGAFEVLPVPLREQHVEASLRTLRELSERSVRQLLIVDDSARRSERTIAAVHGEDLETMVVASREAVTAQLESRHYDGVVLSLDASELDALGVLEDMLARGEGALRPIFLLTERALAEQEAQRIGQLSERLRLVQVSSLEQLLDASVVFLHRAEQHLTEDQRRILYQLAGSEPLLMGRKVLVVDDDMRNIFALTTILERHEMRVCYAENGQQALERLATEEDVEVVLMDIMMPGMDGYEATRIIRQDPRFAALPVIALTAKAMKGDRERCLAVGASDYITKPVDADQLSSLLRVWLSR